MRALDISLSNLHIRVIYVISFAYILHAHSFCMHQNLLAGELPNDYPLLRVDYAKYNFRELVIGGNLNIQIAEPEPHEEDFRPKSRVQHIGVVVRYACFLLRGTHPR